MIEFILYAAITQGLVLGVYFLINQKKYSGAVYQSILLFLISAGIWIGSLYNSHRILDFPHLARVGFLILSLTGGIIYVATRTVLEKSNQLKGKDVLFFIVPTFVILYLTPFYFSSYDNKLNYLKEDLIELHTDCLIISIIATINNFIGIVFSIRLIKNHEPEKSKKANYYYLILSLITIPFLISLANKNILNSGFFSFFISILVIIRSYLIIYNLSSNESSNFFFTIKEEKYGKAKIKQEALVGLGDKIKEYFEKEKPYLDPDFNLKNISDLLNIPPPAISQIFTEYFEKSFYQIVNEYRIQEVIIALNDKTRKNENILQIAFSCGFNAKSTFNDSFKKFTGKTPSQYKKVQPN